MLSSCITFEPNFLLNSPNVKISKNLLQLNILSSPSNHPKSPLCPFLGNFKSRYFVAAAAPFRSTSRQRLILQKQLVLPPPPKSARLPPFQQYTDFHSAHHSSRPTDVWKAKFELNSTFACTELVAEKGHLEGGGVRWNWECAVLCFYYYCAEWCFYFYCAVAWYCGGILVAYWNCS